MFRIKGPRVLRQANITAHKIIRDSFTSDVRRSASKQDEKMEKASTAMDEGTRVSRIEFGDEAKEFAEKQSTKKEAKTTKRVKGEFISPQRQLREYLKKENRLNKLREKIEKKSPDKRTSRETRMLSETVTQRRMREKERLFPKDIVADKPGSLTYGDSLVQQMARNMTFDRGIAADVARRRAASYAGRRGLASPLIFAAHNMAYGMNAALAFASEKVYRSPKFDVELPFGRGRRIRIPVAVGAAVGIEKLSHWNQLDKDPLGEKRYRNPKNNPRYWGNKPY